MKSAKKKIEDFLLGLKCPVQLQVRRSCRDSRFVDYSISTGEATRYRCRNCGWEGTEEEMHGDFAAVPWSPSRICPGCGWWWWLDDYDVCERTLEEIIAEFDARKLILDKDTERQYQDCQQHFAQQIHDLYCNRAVELKKLCKLKRAELAKLTPENHVENGENLECEPE